MADIPSVHGHTNSYNWKKKPSQSNEDFSLDADGRSKQQGKQKMVKKAAAYSLDISPEALQKAREYQEQRKQASEDEPNSS